MAGPMSDIGAAIYALRRGFEKHYMTPVVIELADPEQGMRLKQILEPSLVTMPKFVDQSSNVWNQVEIEGIIIRWPARRVSTGVDSMFYGSVSV